MKRLNFCPRRSSRRDLFLPLRALLVWLLVVAPGWGAEKSIPNYQRFEQSFESAASYANPLQEASLTAVFTSPSGVKLKVPGFWDGGKTWRIRFAPTQPGKWKFETACTDANNKGLHRQAGEFTATLVVPETAFGDCHLRAYIDGRETFALGAKDVQIARRGKSVR